MMSVQLNAGRLIEIRAVGQVTLAEFAAFRTQFTECLVKAGRKVANVVDLRQISVMAPDVFAALSRLVKTDHAMIERAAYLISPTSDALQQVEQLAQDLNHPQRGVFLKQADLEQWIGPVLNAEETARMREFLK